MSTQLHTKIYRKIVDMLEFAHLDRRDIISKCLVRLGLNAEELRDIQIGSKCQKMRAEVGMVLSEMESRGLIATDSDGLYYLVSARPVVIRIEACEKELLSALSERPMTKPEIRDRLKSVFGTDKTPTTKDDDTLFTFMGQTLKRLCAVGIIQIRDGRYELSAKASAKSNDMNAMLALRSEFIAKLHSSGGEFFEIYFMELLARYYKKHGKEVVTSYVTGGASDGGIDGVIKTVDSLGFRETTMVQMKNRTDIVSETDVRGFYGAVCAKGGSRGIFACTSDFHDGAKGFLDGIDNCIGVNGTILFKMACECLYGIKKNKEALSVDDRIIKRG